MVRIERKDPKFFFGSRVKKEIEELRATLAQERLKKKNKDEYLALAKLIHDLPKRSESEKYHFFELLFLI